MNKAQCCEILKVSENISKEELKKKFKLLILKYHPDRNKSPGATEKFIQIKDAYEQLIKYLEPSPTTIYPGQGFYTDNNYNSTVTIGNVGTWTFTFTTN